MINAYLLPYIFQARKETCSQTSPELQAIASNEGQRPYRICNQFGTPLQLSVVQPNRLQRSGKLTKLNTVLHATQAFILSLN